MSSIICAAVILGGLLFAGCGDDEKSAQASRSSYFGINAQHLPILARAEEDELLARHLRAVGALGVGFVRANANWALAQPHPPTPEDAAANVEVWDSWVGALAKQGLRWQPTIIGLATPAWAADPDAVAECGSRSPPADPADFAKFAAAIAARFGRDGSFWDEHPELEPQPVVEYEIWNSPNYGFFWCPAPQPERYGALYAAARSAIHAADGDARVLVAGLGPFTEDSLPTPRANLPADEFVSRMLATDELEPADVDAIGIHLYGPDAATLIEQVTWFRGVLEENGLGETPMVVAEVGWATSGSGGPPAIPEEARAAELSAVTHGVLAEGCGVIQYSPHTWTTPEADASDAEDWYGIADIRTVETYPTAERYEADVAELDDETPEEQDTPGCEGE